MKRLVTAFTLVALAACATPKQGDLHPAQAEGLRKMNQAHKDCEQEVKAMKVAPDVGAAFHANCMRGKGYIVQ